jgi:hypothetical protein
MSSAQTLNQAGKFYQVRGSKPAFAEEQCGEGVLWSQISPIQWNLTLPALLADETHSVFIAIFFAGESFKLAPRQRMKRMRDQKSLGVCSTNACSPTLLPWSRSTRRTRSRLPGAVPAIGTCSYLRR